MVPRAEFLAEFKRDYQAGQHVTFLGPTQRGKTYLSQQMLKQVINPKLPCVILAGKPPNRDATMASAAQRLNLRIVEEWPPVRTYKDRKRNGYVLRPHHTMKDLKADEQNLHDQFDKALQSCYASRTPVIIVLDESYQVQKDLGLQKRVEAPLLRGAPVCAEWNLLQRGRYSSYLVYDAPEHVIIFSDPDVSNVKRYSELIGGVDPRYVTAVVTNLRTARTSTGRTISEALYIRRSGPELYVIRMD